MNKLVVLGDRLDYQILRNVKIRELRIVFYMVIILFLVKVIAQRSLPVEEVVEKKRPNSFLKRR